jgi:predicted metalloprotease with PDZ domain
MSVSHDVRLSDAHAHLVTIRSTFRSDDGGALPDPLVVWMPVWTPGSYLVREYARHVERLGASGEGGAAATATKIRKNAWSIRHGGAREVTLTYDLYCNDLSVRTNHVDATHVYLNGAATFLTAEHAPNASAEVRFDLPAGFSIATALRRDGDAWIARSYDELVDCPIHAGHALQREFMAAGKPHTFAIWGEAPAADWNAIVRDTTTIIETEAKLFGGSLPYDAYTFLWLVNGKNRGGLEHETSTTLTVQPSAFEDRRGTLDVLSLVAHEFFHLWSVKRIRPEGLWPYRYEEENYTRLLWWFEGGTSYFDWRILRLCGLCTVEEYLEHLGEELARLEDTPGRMAQSCAEASYDAWIKLYRADENTVNSTVSYYLKGEIVCAMLDVEMRARTEGRRGLDDVMLAMWKRFGEQGKPVPEGAMPALFAEIAGVPMDDVLAAWVEGREELPIDAVLAKVGLEISRGARDGKKQKGALGLRLRTSEGRAFVASVLRNRPGHRAGIDVGDEIVAIEGRRIENGRIDTALAGRAPGSEVEVTLARDGALRTVRATLDAAPPEKLKITMAEGASSKERALCEGWLRGVPGAAK